MIVYQWGNEGCDFLDICQIEYSIFNFHGFGDL